MLHIKEITEYIDLLKIEDTWNRLLIDAEIDNPYLSFDWFKIAFKHFEKDEKLFILIVEDGDRAIAIAPLLISAEKNYGISIKKLRFLNNVNTPFQDFILTQNKNEALGIILDYLQRNCRLWDLIELNEIRSESECINILGELCKTKKLFYHQFFLSRSWYVSTNISWDEGLDKISSKTQKEFRRKIRRIEKLGRLSFQVITEPAHIEKHLDIFFDLYKQSWKGEELNADFYYKIAEEFSKKKDFILYCLCLDERPIAYMFGLRTKSTLFGIKTTYDPAYYAYAPGIILFYKILESSFHNSEIKKFDIGRGEERYKQELASSPINQFNLVIGHKKSLFSLLYHIRYTLASFFKARKGTRCILSFLKYSSNFIREVPKYIRKFKTTLFRHSSEIIFYKNLDLVFDGNKKNDLICKKADLEDMDQLVVAMKAKNIKDINERLEKENCFIVLKDSMIYNYFWFDKNVVSDSLPKINDEQTVLKEFDPLTFKMNEYLLKKTFNTVFNELVKYQHKSLFAISKSNDNHSEVLFESLGFQVYKLINNFHIFNIKIRLTKKLLSLKN